ACGAAEENRSRRQSTAEKTCQEEGCGQAEHNPASRPSGDQAAVGRRRPSSTDVPDEHSCLLAFGLNFGGIQTQPKASFRKQGKTPSKPTSKRGRTGVSV